MPDHIIILVISLFVAMVFGMAGSILILNRKQSQKRAISIISGKPLAATEDSTKEILDKRRAEMAKKLHDNEGPKTKKTAALRDLLRHAGLSNFSIKKFWMVSIASGAIFSIAMLMLGQGPLVISFFWVIGTFGLPRLFLKMKAKNRQKKFLEEMPDALESMVRLLKAGMPIGEAISMVAREFSGPVGDEMSKVYEEQKIGISLSEACQHAAERMPITEMQMFATGITIQQQTGSSLSEILSNIARVIRARFRLKRKVQALSSEAKSSAIIIGALPILVASGLYAINPHYMEPLFYTFKGKLFLSGAGGMMLFGSLVMRQMINFKV